MDSSKKLPFQLLPLQCFKEPCSCHQGDHQGIPFCPPLWWQDSYHYHWRTLKYHLRSHHLNLLRWKLKRQDHQWTLTLCWNLKDYWWWFRLQSQQFRLLLKAHDFRSRTCFPYFEHHFWKEFLKACRKLQLIHRRNRWCSSYPIRKAYWYLQCWWKLPQSLSFGIH